MSDRKNFSVFLSLPNLSLGGAQKQTVAIANGLSRRGVKCLIFTLERGEIDNEIHSAVKVASPCHPSFIKKFRFLSVIWGIFALARSVSKEKPDILYSRHWTKIPNVIIGKFFGIRTVWSEGNGAMFLKKTNPLLFLAHRLAVSHADLITANSKGLADEIRDMYKLKKTPEIAYNCIDTKGIESKSSENAEHKWFGAETPLIISVCRLAPHKGVGDLIEALKIVNEKKSVRLLVLGDGKSKKELMAHAREIGISDKIDFLSREKNPHRFTAKCDVFVCPSEQEGFSNSLIEAAVLGMPIVSTNHPFGADEIIQDGASGLLVPVNSPKAMAGAILRLIEDKVTAKKMGGAAKKHAENFNIEKMAERSQRIFEKVGL